MDKLMIPLIKGGGKVLEKSGLKLGGNFIKDVGTSLCVRPLKILCTRKGYNTMENEVGSGC